MSYFTTRSGRIVAGTLVGALALSVTPIVGFFGTAGAADALPPLADPIGAGNFCENASATEPFTDVSDTDAAQAVIACLVDADITQGTTATTYSPNGSVTRRQMVLFLKRLADLSNAEDTGTNIAALPADDGTADFNDIGAESAAVKTAVDQLANANVVQGITADTFGPGELVSRRQMAAFVNRLQAFLTGTAFTTSGDFFDDDNGDSGEANLNAVASVGIFQGDGAGNVFPGSNLTRRQMANILLRNAQVNFDAGDIDTPFVAAPPSSNQTYSVTPTDEGRVDFGATATAATTRSFVATVPSGTVVDIRLFAATQIRTTATGTTTYAGTGQAFFLDANSDNIADPSVPAGSSITVVNGVASGGDQITSSGSISFTVTSTAAADLFPVVFADASDDDTIALTAPTPANANAKLPTDAFGIGGRTHFTATEGALGTIAAGDTVTEVNRNLDYFVSTLPRTYNYDSNDVFQYGGVGITMAEFEGLLTIAGANAAADAVTGSYSPEPAGVSTFNVSSAELVPTATVPAAPLVVGVATNTDGGTTNNDVVLNWTASTQPDATYTITRDVDSSGTINAGDVTLATGVTGTTATFANEPTDADVEYLITTVGGKSLVSNATLLSSGNLVVPGAADTTRPTSIDLVTTTTGGLAGTLDTGDVFKVVFSETIVAPASGAKIRINDGDAVNTIVDVICGTNATCTLNAVAETVNGTSRAAGLVVTVTLTADPTVIQAGTAAGLQFPGTVTDSAGFADAAANTWNLAGSADIVVDGA